MTQLYIKKQFEGQNIDLSAYVYRAGSFHYNWHEDIELVTVVDGEIELCTDGSVSRLARDDVQLINANYGHATLSRTVESTILLLRVHSKFFMDYLPDFARMRLHISSRGAESELPVFCRMRRCMARVILSLFSPPGEAELDILCAFYTLVGIMRDAFPLENASSSTLAEKGLGDNVRRVISYMEEHYRERLTLKEVADIFNYNSSYMSQLFKEHVGINFYDYLTRVRLHHATRALSTTDRRIVDIAAEHGFVDLKSFNAKFREIFGRSPHDYRRSLTPAHRTADKYFKNVFIDSDDEKVMRRLAAYASYEPCDCGRCEAVHPAGFSDAAAKLRRASEYLATLADDFDRL